MEIACLIDRRSYTGRALDALEATEALIQDLETIGAGVESERVGEAYFAVDGIRPMYGGSSGEVLGVAQRVAGGGWAIATGPTRFAAFLAASEWRRPFPVEALRTRLDRRQLQAGDLIEALERLGITRLKDFARLTDDQVADRFGPLGLQALCLCRGEEEPLRPRTPHEELAEEIELPEGSAGRLLDRALELLVDRLLAGGQRRGRTLLALRLGARLASGGSWSIAQGLGRPSASPAVLRNVLAPRLEELPGPATALCLRAIGLGPPAGDQLELSVGGDEPRRRRLGAAVREVRAAQGTEALLKILPVDGSSRVPERWAMLTPFPEL